MIVVVFGLPGSGKTYLAHHLAAKLKAVHLSSDIVRKQMSAVGTYSEQDKLHVYNKMRDQMRAAIKANENLVVDATFYKDSIRRLFIKESRNIFFVEVKADEKLVAERLKEKRIDSEADFEVYKKVAAEFESMMEPHLTLYSTNDNLKDMIDKTMHYLNVEHDARSG